MWVDSRRSNEETRGDSRYCGIAGNLNSAAKVGSVAEGVVKTLRRLHLRGQPLKTSTWKPQLSAGPSRVVLLPGRKEPMGTLCRHYLNLEGAPREPRTPLGLVATNFSF